MPGKLPIIYVRGYAGGTGGINTATDDPFYGFNSGSTHVHNGMDGKPKYYQFEGPLLRLVRDLDYAVIVEGDQDRFLTEHPDGAAKPATIWIDRFYDIDASTFGVDAKPFHLEEAAEGLFELIKQVCRVTNAPRVYLVAHSMGGLICRSTIQRVIPEHGLRAADFVDRLYTYATPHDGITFGHGHGILERLRDLFDPMGSDIFGPEHMYAYLTPTDEQLPGGPPPGWRAKDMPDSDNFPLERIFCMVGTNAKDYGPVEKVVGVMSDGLVQIQNAYVTNASHAYAYRCHSGRYGIVNSEEGYQNLRRFLFGDIEVTADLIGLDLPTGVAWQAEVQFAIRGLDALINERSRNHNCPIVLSSGEGPVMDVSAPLAKSFLDTKLAVKEACRYSLHVRIMSVRDGDDVDQLEQVADFDDYLLVDLKVSAAGDGFDAWANWQSELDVGHRSYEPTGDPLGDEAGEPGLWQHDIGLPGNAKAKFGATASVRLTARPH